MSPRLRARLLFHVDDPRDKRGRVILPIAIAVSILAHIPAVPVLARIAPQRQKSKTVHLELLMECIARRIEPAVEAEPDHIGSSLDGPEKSGAGDAAGLVGAPPSRSSLQLGSSLQLQERGSFAPSVRTAVATVDPDAPGRISKKWFAWYCRRLREDISDNYPFDMLAKRGIEGEIKFRVEIYPDGRLQRLVILSSDHPLMRTALEIAVKKAVPLPGYRELGLEWFPPLNMSISH